VSKSVELYSAWKSVESSSRVSCLQVGVYVPYLLAETLADRDEVLLVRVARGPFLGEGINDVGSVLVTQFPQDSGGGHKMDGVVRFVGVESVTLELLG